MTPDPGPGERVPFRVRAAAEDLPGVFTDILIYGFVILGGIGFVEWIVNRRAAFMLRLPLTQESARAG